MTGSLPDLLELAARERPDHPAVVADRTLTYSELDDLSRRAGAALVAEGVAPGDRVAVTTRKSAAAIATLYGVMRAGAAYVPIDPSAGTRAEVITGNADPTVVIDDPLAFVETVAT